MLLKTNFQTYHDSHSSYYTAPVQAAFQLLTSTFHQQGFSYLTKVMVRGLLNWGGGGGGGFSYLT